MITLFGLNVDSFMDIPFGRKSRGKRADVILKSKQVPCSLKNPLVKTPFFQISNHEFLLDIPGKAKFYVFSGREIQIEKTGDITDKGILPFLIDSVFAVLLFQRGILCFNGTALERNNKCVLLAGPKGSGKSSAGVELLKRGGFSLVSDGIIAFSDKKVFSGAGFISLWADMAEVLGFDIEHLEPVGEKIRRYKIPCKIFNETFLELSRIYIMDDYRGNNFSLSRLKGASKFLEFYNCLAWHNLTKNIIESNSFFFNITNALKDVNITKVNYFFRSDRHKSVKAVADLIEKDFSV